MDTIWRSFWKRLMSKIITLQEKKKHFQPIMEIIMGKCCNIMSFWAIFTGPLIGNFDTGKII